MTDIKARVVFADYHPLWRGIGFKLTEVDRTFLKGEERTRFSCVHNTTEDVKPNYCHECGQKRWFTKHPTWKTGDSTASIVLSFAGETGDFLYHEDDATDPFKNLDLKAMSGRRSLLEAFMFLHGLKGVYNIIKVHNRYD